MVQTSLSDWIKKAQQVTEDNIDVPLKNANPKQPCEPASLVPTTTNTLQESVVTEPTIGNLWPETGKKSFHTHSRALPPNATLAAITTDTLPSFKRMNAVLLPVPYPDKFYSDTINDEVAASISMIVLWSDSTKKESGKPRVVSGIRCRLLANSQLAPLSKNDDSTSLYISTITTLAPFRGHGLASALLERVTARAIHDYGITTVTAHMWEANEEAREWYGKHGFKELHFDKDYYRKLRPSGAFLLQKRIGPQDLLRTEHDD